LRYPNQAPLPDSANSIRIKNAFIRDNGDTFGLSLGNQHAVERIFVWPGQQASANGMVRRDREQFESFARYNAHKISGQLRSSGKFAEADLGGNFPRRSGAYDHSVIGLGDELPGWLA
jgi:hypothetical protein